MFIFAEPSYSSKNPYGNKTKLIPSIIGLLSYSSKNPYGNKTMTSNGQPAPKSYSSKNPYGNKTPLLLIPLAVIVLF